MSEEIHGENQKSRKPNRNWIKGPLGYLVAAFAAAGLSVAVFAGAQYFSARGVAGQSVLDNPAQAETKTDTAAVSQLKQTSESFRNVAKIVGPAVVHIKSTKGGKPKAGPGRPTRRGRRGAPPGGDDGGPGAPGMPGGPQDPFFDFFEKFGNPFQGQGPETPQTSLGSGVIIDKKGYVVTNNHVVEDASEILVALPGDKSIDMKAKVIGTDPKTDLALLKIESSTDLPVAEWADSSQVEVGDWAIAIGSPFDLRQTLTVGVVSAMGRSSNVLAGADYVGELIQTDAAINPGNSGGPLCTLDGKIMGVNTAIYTRSGGYMGIGFAIPANLAKDIIEKLRTNGKVVRGWLGVFIQQLQPELAKDLGIQAGVSIHDVIEDSPAAKAGIAAGDVVLGVEGKPVKEVNELQRIISSFKPGQTVRLDVMSYNDKKKRTVTVKIGTVPENEPEVAAAPEEEAPDKLGLVVGSAKGKDGVTIVAVQPGSPAEQIGLEPGDSVTRVNRNKVNSAAEYKKEVSRAKKIITLEVKQKGRAKFYSLPLPE